MDYLISVVIPVYNAADSLRRCVESVQSQGLSKLEIILIDDGSADGSGALCDTLAAEDTRIRVIHKRNEGPGLARRDGCHAAGGDYIAFVDSDDYIKNDMLQTMLEIITRERADIVQCGFSAVDKAGGLIAEHRMPPETVTGERPCAAAFVRRKNMFGFLCNNLFRASLFRDVQFPPLYFCEDACLTAQLYAAARKLVTIENPFYCYVQSADSLCRSDFPLGRLDAVRAGKFIYEFYEKGFPELLGYAASYICFYAARYYCQVKNLDFCDKEKLLQELLSDFRQYYEKSRAVFSALSMKRKVMLLGFHVSPGFCAVASGLYDKIKK